METINMYVILHTCFVAADTLQMTFPDLMMEFISRPMHSNATLGMSGTLGFGILDTYVFTLIIM